jgi:hypothetical protein
MKLQETCQCARHEPARAARSQSYYEFFEDYRLLALMPGTVGGLNRGVTATRPKRSKRGDERGDIFGIIGQ